MKIAYFDCIAGASGDMILGALIDAGLPAETLKEKLAALHLADFELKIYKVKKNGFSATKVDVIVSDKTPERHLSDIEKIVAGSDLSLGIKEKAMEIFRQLCEVEAGIHGSSPDKVHLHELGGVDTIVDVVGALSGLAALGIAKIYASPLPMGRGFIKGAHGQIPLPAPATIGLLKNVSIIGSAVETELVTPTGAVLLKTLAENFGPIPAMTLKSLGYGAGSRDLTIPNVLRLLIGESESQNGIVTESLMKLETNIDDQNPEFFGYVMDKLFAAGALDVFLTPIQMKKNRPAVILQALCSPEKSDDLERIIFRETSSLGVRKYMIIRACLPRAVKTVTTKFGKVRIKIAQTGSGDEKLTPEYEDCRKLAEEQNVPLREIYFAAEQSAKSTIQNSID
ncbi:MAG TPA: nickel pincer cofactor biosynthesis protein LarC [Bacteroidetes bacterium]|nr:nickel pincer cofactor biosynthesis protein LarC [Bacteroidota bacterium]